MIASGAEKPLRGVEFSFAQALHEFSSGMNMASTLYCPGLGGLQERCHGGRHESVGLFRGSIPHMLPSHWHRESMQADSALPHAFAVPDPGISVPKGPAKAWHTGFV